MPGTQTDLDVKSTAQVKKVFSKPAAVIGSGGAVLGIAEAGALHALTINRVMSETILLVGSSIAAFMLAISALNLPFDKELKKLLTREIDLRKFLDLSWMKFLFILLKAMREPTSGYRYNQLKFHLLMFNFIKKLFTPTFGLCSGLYIEKVIKQKSEEALSPHKGRLLTLVEEYLNDKSKRQQILKKEAEEHLNQWEDNHLVDLLLELKNTLAGKGSLTLGGLHLLTLLDKSLGFKDLVATALNTSMKPGVVEFFSYKSKPHLLMERAVHASMAIPFLFEPVEIDGCIYQDGSLGANTPVCYVKQQPNMIGKEYLILDFGSAPKYKPTTNFLEQCWRVITGSFWGSQRSYFTAADYLRTIFQNRLGVSPGNFFVSTKGQEKLFYKGVDCAVDYLKDKIYVDEKTQKP